MKLVACTECNDIMNLHHLHVRTCYCGAVGGRYLSDFITAVVNKDAIVVGIDNNGFSISKNYYQAHQEIPHRVDIFFTGWIPNHPGEVVVVDSVEDVLAYPFEMDEEDKVTTSTLPSQNQEKETKKKRKRIWDRFL